MSSDENVYKMLQATSSASPAKVKPEQAVRPLVWAVDPFDRDIRRMRPLVQAIDTWRGSRSTNLFPVSILAPYDMGWAPELFFTLLEGSATSVLRNLRVYLNKFSLKSMKMPKLILAKTASRRHGAEAIAKFAKDQEAELIFAATHGRRGFQRARLGSFAENLLAVSKVPVMVVNEKARMGKKISCILFPVDFSANSMVTLKYVIKWAKRFQAKVKLYHLMDTPTAAYTYWEGADPGIIDAAVKKAERALHAKGTALTAGLRKQNIDCEFVLETRPSLLGKAIARNAKNFSADVIVLTATRGPLGQALFGGSIREVLCTSPSPSIVVHSR